jgi:hypothetical protein
MKEKGKTEMRTAEELFGATFTVDPSLGNKPHKPSSTLKIINEWLSTPGNLHELIGKPKNK